MPENYTYAQLAKFIKNRKTLTEDSLEGLEEITMDSAKAQAILDASKSSMGGYSVTLKRSFFIRLNLASPVIIFQTFN